ncbi:hypothetical protein PpBr36_02978 [Pyricularia pennisetigena]|uniref:hypothetical protein n=1 Tax=Pyricularia pennisetigena TaxID=1578925 RepID=UPI001152D299|nr:hypothetical protein PpBr36_02978 [Pyricularia pennisetigena]TLS31144.1 hypothetical protein PpBr36_02978 [Pyricularia pennisetigena]
MIEALVICLLFIIAMATLYYAYQQGYLDPYIEQVGTYLFKAKAMAEKKRLQAQGMKAGQDFVDSQLAGAQQADQVKAGVGAIGGLKKRF